MPGKDSESAEKGEVRRADRWVKSADCGRLINTSSAQRPPDLEPFFQVPKTLRVAVSYPTISDPAAANGIQSGKDSVEHSMIPLRSILWRPWCYPCTKTSAARLARREARVRPNPRYRSVEVSLRPPSALLSNDQLIRGRGTLRSGTPVARRQSRTTVVCEPLRMGRCGEGRIAHGNDQVIIDARSSRRLDYARSPFIG